MNKVNRIWVVGNGAMLNYKVYNKIIGTQYRAIFILMYPNRYRDEQITVAGAVLLDGPIKLYRGVGQVAR